MADTKKRSRLIDYAIAFVLVYIVSQLVMRQFFPSIGAPPQTGILLKPQSASVRIGAAAEHITVENKTDKTFTLASRCPNPPFDVYRVSENGAMTVVSGTGTAIPCTEIPALEPIPAGEKSSVSLDPWKYSIFAQEGTYEVRVPSTAQLGSGSALQSASGGVISAQFTVVQPNVFVKLFRAVISKPLLNVLIFIASVTPGHNLGVGIIILTILVKLLLFIPTQHALEGQKKMQLLQPKLEAVKRQHKDNPQRAQEETMKLWKEHKVNPLQSCLPVLIQFPVLIGLFYTIRDGSNLALSHDLIYPVYQNLSWNFNTQFLWLDLTKPNLFLFPPLLIILQFIQMKLSFVIADRKKAKQIEKAEEKTGLEMQQKIMLYILPLMIGFFAIRLPAAVAVYWGVSTLFAIGQQMIVNREHIKA